MKFDKSKTLTCVTADQAKVGMKGWFADTLEMLEEKVNYHNPSELTDVLDERGRYRFEKEMSHNLWSLFYPAPEHSHAERQAEWVKEHDIQVGTKVRITRDFGKDWEAGTTGHSGVAGMTGKVWGMGPHYVDVVCNQDRIVRTTPYYVLEVIKEPTYRPFHDDELNDIVGKVVVQNYTGNAMLIIKVVDSETGKVVSLGGNPKRNAQQLLEGYTLHGQPCGVKEEV